MVIAASLWSYLCFVLKQVDVLKYRTLNCETCMLYSRRIKVFKCQYAHVAHICLSFGCTDGDVDVGLYLITSGILSNISNINIRFWESWNLQSHVFCISKNPDLGKPQNISLFSISTPDQPRGGLYVTILGPLD